MTGSVHAADGEQWIFEVPPDMTVRYVRLLRRGPNWTAEETPETEHLQAAHLAYGRQLIAAGKLILNGPMLDGGDLRGLSVLRVGSLEEAQALAEADPAVQAGRLNAEVHPWMVFKGILPE